MGDNRARRLAVSSLVLAGLAAALSAPPRGPETVSAAGLIAGLAVSDAANAADWSIQPALRRADTQYGDRTYGFTTVPSTISGSEWIRTANDSKAFTGTTVAAFTVTAEADVYVALNDRITAVPAWLGGVNGWSDTTESLVNDESTPRTFRLFRKTFPAGARVTLGPGGSTSSSFYSVVVKPAGPPTPASAPRNLVSPPRTQTDSSVLLLWDKPEDIATIPFAAYAVYRDGVPVGETTKLGFTVGGLAPETSYVFTVRTRETDGSLSEDSLPVTVATTARGAVLDVRNFGARGDGSTLNTRAIQSAIDACPAGGTVLVPSGTFVSGALFLKSNMTFRIAAGGVLKGSTNIRDYPLIPSRFEGFELPGHASLLTLGLRDRNGPFNISNVTIAGEGTIDGSGRDLGNAQRAANGNRARGRAIIMLNAQNVYVQGLTVSYGPAWTVHAIYSRQVTFSGLRLVSKNSSYRIANGDGIDADSSTHVNIFDCHFHTGDDSIAIKSGKNLEGYTVGKPTEDVRVTDVVIDGSNGGIVIGSEMSGSVRRVLVQNASIRGLSWEGLDIKSNVVRGGTVEDVVFKDITMSRVRQAIRVTMNYSTNNDGTPAPVPPTFRNVRFENIRCPSGGGRGIWVIGLPSSIVRNVLFRNIDLTSTNGVTVDYANTVTFEDVSLDISSGPPYTITHSSNVVVR